jgi:N-acetylglucosamine-6-sulfatase
MTHLSTLALLTLPLCAGAALAADPTNVLVIITDDQRFDALGFVQREQGERARFPFFQTPHLDRLASTGVSFRNAFVTHSLCSPSRASMLSGQPTHAHEVRDNRTPFRSPDTWPFALRDAGYMTGYFGKWHMGTQPDRPGFTEVFTFIDQGVYPNAEFFHNGVRTPTEGWVDDVTTTRAIDFIQRQRRQPFAMVVGYKSPHDVREPPPRHASLYADARIAEPRSFHDHPPFRPPHHAPVWNPQIPDYLNYFRCLQGVDDNVGRLLDALDAAGIADRTLVVYVSDNGYYLREHGLGDKRTAYEESIRIPLLMRLPGVQRTSGQVDAMALNLDLPATILEAAGVPLTWDQAGRSLLPWLRGETPSDWRHEFLYENYQDADYPTVTFDVIALRTESAKLVEYPGRPEWNQVFDLKTDPDEVRNLIHEPGAARLVEELQRRLHLRMTADGFPKDGNRP